MCGALFCAALVVCRLRCSIACFIGAITARTIIGQGFRLFLVFLDSEFLESALAGKVEADVVFGHPGYRLVWALIRLVFSARERSP